MLRTYIDFSDGGHWTGVGSRETPSDMKPFFSDIAKHFFHKGLVLRSGAAKGADDFFESGIGYNNTHKEIYIPTEFFNSRTSGDGVITLNDLQDEYNNVDDAIGIAKMFIGHWDSLGAYARLLHTRNVYQVLGKDLRTPSLFLICYADMNVSDPNHVKGGTNTAVQIAKKIGIPVFNIKYDYDCRIVQEWIGGIK